MTKKNIVVVVVVAVLVAVGGSWLIENRATERNQALLSEINEQLANREAALHETADMVRNSTPDASTEAVVRDCQNPDRVRFDSLLDKLSTPMSRTELEELNMLFHRCGDFFAKQKLLMAFSLSLQVENFEHIIALADTLKAEVDEAARTRLRSWQQLAANEVQSANLFFDLVQHQASIISLLLSGSRADSPEIAAILAAVQETRSSLAVNSVTTETTRRLLEAQQ